MFEELEQRLEGRAASRRPGVPAAGLTASPGGQVIREIMDPVFLHGQLEAIRAVGAADPAGCRLADEHYETAFAELAAASAAAPAGAGPPFMPHGSPVVAMLQSTLTTCLESGGAELEPAPDGMARLAHRVLGRLENFREFGPCDPRWIECKLAEGVAMLDRRPPFPAAAAPPVRLADDARVIVVGDWGSGLPGAVEVAQQIGRQLEDGRGREQHVIHLGDVYYSGWREEYEQRFLPHWPVGPQETEVLSWSLNGNHDMFSGGHGYFGFLLLDPRFRGHLLDDDQPHLVSSYFSLENDHWQLLGLDSAYDASGLAGGQADWVAQKLEANDRRTMLLSHHQPFSAYDGQVKPHLLERLQPALAQRPLDAWFWGHEHRCTVYADQPAPYLKFGSCVGHGGVPRMLPDPTPRTEPRVTWSSAAGDDVDGQKWGRFGFAVLDFAGPRLEVRYIDETGAVEHTRTI